MWNLCYALTEAKDIARDILASNIGVMSNEKLFFKPREIREFRKLIC